MHIRIGVYLNLFVLSRASLPLMLTEEPLSLTSVIMHPNPAEVFDIVPRSCGFLALCMVCRQLRPWLPRVYSPSC